MRIWDIPPEYLCRKHLLGLHYEIHAINGILDADNPGGYKNHPEVLRWKSNRYTLYVLHVRVANEMERRGYKHQSPMLPVFVPSPSTYVVRIEPLIPMEEQVDLLTSRCKDCAEKLAGM